jgi:predicted AAA+ superfamily ATPase
MYIKRNLKDFFLKCSSQFPVMLVTGARQVGKTTFLQHIKDKSRNYISLDSLKNQALAKSDPELFLQRFKPPLLIDEIQYAPELLPYIKIMVDSEQKPGMFWLTGSQQFQMMSGVTESLAGRVGIVNLMGLSNRELDGKSTFPFLPTLDFSSDKSSLDLSGLYRRIWHGAFPMLNSHPEIDRNFFYESYISTYLERDVRELSQVGDMQRFFRFLRAAAARTGQLLNYSDLARDADISVPTAKNWLSILLSSGLTYLLEPYYSNRTKRLTQTPKLYFLDTGLCTYLTDWFTPESLEAGAMSGAIFETWCFVELLKSYRHSGQRAPFFFYRDFDQVEIDLIIEYNGTLYPVEFKKSANPGSDAAKNFKILERLNQPVGTGAIICMSSIVMPLTRSCQLIPAAVL